MTAHNETLHAFRHGNSSAGHTGSMHARVFTRMNCSHGHNQEFIPLYVDSSIVSLDAPALLPAGAGHQYLRRP